MEISKSLLNFLGCFEENWKISVYNRNVLWKLLRIFFFVARWIQIFFGKLMGYSCKSSSKLKSRVKRKNLGRLKNIRQGLSCERMKFLGEIATHWYAFERKPSNIFLAWQKKVCLAIIRQVCHKKLVFWHSGIPRKKAHADVYLGRKTRQ